MYYKENKQKKNVSYLLTPFFFLLCFTGIMFATCTSPKEEKSILKMKISGMHCASCVVSVNKALKDIPGVKNVKVRPAYADAIMKIDRTLLDTLSLIDAVQKTGFGATLEVK
jgi:copper chaperone CopZ